MWCLQANWQIWCQCLSLKSKHPSWVLALCGKKFACLVSSNRQNTNQPINSAVCEPISLLLRWVASRAAFQFWANHWSPDESWSGMERLFIHWLYQSVIFCSHGHKSTTQVWHSNWCHCVELAFNIRPSNEPSETTQNQHQSLSVLHGEICLVKTVFPKGKTHHSGYKVQTGELSRNGFFCVSFLLYPPPNEFAHLWTCLAASAFSGALPNKFLKPQEHKKNVWQLFLLFFWRATTLNPTPVSLCETI